MTAYSPRQVRSAHDASGSALVGVCGVVLEAYPEGALWWGDEHMLVVADLHFEKGSSFARRGQLLPPYDTAETLSRLSRLVAHLDPKMVVALGDSFHDNEGPARLSQRDRAAIATLQTGREWIWIAGNHDHDAAGLDGTHLDMLAIGKLVFRHEPEAGAATGEIAGHLHPAARIAGRGKWVRRRCFVGDGTRLILPAFGAYAGGLNILDRAFGGLFADRLSAFMLGEEQVYPVGHRLLRPD